MIPSSSKSIPKVQQDKPDQQSSHSKAANSRFGADSPRSADSRGLPLVPHQQGSTYQEHPGDCEEYRPMRSGEDSNAV
jgi:hypothetical protein